MNERFEINRSKGEPPHFSQLILHLQPLLFFFFSQIHSFNEFLKVIDQHNPLFFTLVVLFISSKLYFTKQQVSEDFCWVDISLSLSFMLKVSKQKKSFCKTSTNIHILSNSRIQIQQPL